MGLLVFFFISFIAFFQSTLSGGGAALLLLPILGMVLGSQMIAPVMTIGTSITGFSRLFLFWKHIDWALVRWYAIPSSIAASIGSYCLLLADAKWLQLIIGIFLITSILQFIDKGAMGKKAEPATETNKKEKTVGLTLFIIIGMVVAFLSGLIGGVGPLMNVVYIKYGLDKEKLIGTRTANEVLIHFVKLIVYFTIGDFPFVVIFTGFIIGISGIFGSILGKKLLLKMSSVWFLRMVLMTMLLSGILMIWQALENF
ncbi:sulfite exporter TauE/SafE family protein [Leptospira sp. 96542]|nr:sulfite exporter TauE/SafE family protein [Leptospira sp. 96542]